MGLRREKNKSRREGGSFEAIPHVVMNNRDFQSLSGSAIQDSSFNNLSVQRQQ